MKFIVVVSDFLFNLRKVGTVRLTGIRDIFFDMFEIICLEVFALLKLGRLFGIHLSNEEVKLVLNKLSGFDGFIRKKLSLV